MTSHNPPEKREVSVHLRVLKNRPTHPPVDPRLLQPADPAEDLIPPDAWVLIEDALDLSVQDGLTAMRWFEGETRKKIANELHVEETTIQQHINRTYAKFRVETKSQFIQRAVRVYQMLNVGTKTNPKQ